MWFGSRKPKRIVVGDFREACDLLVRMGVDLKPRANPALAGRAVIVRNNGLSWVFAGDTEVFTIGRTFEAREGWRYDDLNEWLYRKNFATAVHDPDSGNLIVTTNILVEGGVILENMARIVIHFDETISSFMETMGLSPSHLRPLA